MCNLIVFFSEGTEAHDGIHGSMLHTDMVALESYASLVEKLVDATFIGLLTIGEETP